MSPPPRALITMAIGKLDYADKTLPLMRYWAERQGWDFIVINQRLLRTNPNWPRRRFGVHIEKFQIQPFLERYERIIYLDADILVNPAVPDPFELVPPESIGGVWDDTGADAWKREFELDRLARVHGPLPAMGSGPRFLNAGFLVMGPAHRELWRFDRNAFLRGRWPEQSLFNYRVLRSRTPVHELPSSFNLMPLHHREWHSRESRHAAFLVHYASRPAKITMERDYEHFAAAWEADRAKRLPVALHRQSAVSGGY